MNDQQAKIRKGVPKRDPVSYRVEQDIVIPAGTILRSQGEGKFGCVIGLGACGIATMFSLDEAGALTVAGVLKKVIAA